MKRILDLLARSVLVYVILSVMFMIVFLFILSLASFLTWDWLFTSTVVSFTSRLAVSCALVVGTIMIMIDPKGLVEAFEEESEKWGFND